MQFKKFFAVLPALALSTALVAAQEPQPTSTQQTTQTTVGQPTDTNEPVYKGCVSGTKDTALAGTRRHLARPQDVSRVVVPVS